MPAVNPHLLPRRRFRALRGKPGHTVRQRDPCERSIVETGSGGRRFVFPSQRADLSNCSIGGPNSRPVAGRRFGGPEIGGRCHATLEKCTSMTFAAKPDRFDS